MEEAIVFVTKEEQKWIKDLERLIKKAPKRIELFGWAGTLIVLKRIDAGKRAVMPANFGKFICDGGDPPDDEVIQLVKYEYE